MLNRDIIIKIIVILFIALIFLMIYKLFQPTECCEGMVNIEKIDNANWKRNTCNYYLGETMKDVFTNNKIKKTTSNDAKITIPCDYDDQDKEIDMMVPQTDDQRFFIIHNADTMTAKEELWTNVLLHHGYDKAKTMMPNTYVLNNKQDINRLQQEHNNGNIYIMKKNIQRQEGLKITDSLGEVVNGYRSGYVIAQELLQDPYTISGRKINLRFYILVICKQNNLDVFIYNDGFMYYTKDQFIKGSTEDGPNITTGYIDRSVYDENPLTHEDLKIYLDNPTRKLTAPEQNIREQNLNISDVVFGRINELLKNVYLSFFGKICNGEKLKPYVSFQLFGVDIAINDKLNPTIMEINKGPDMGAKDDRDKQLKYKCMQDVFKLIGAIDDTNNNSFTKILEIEDGKVL